MAEPTAPESPKPGVERSTAGLVVALYLAAAIFLVYLAFQLGMDLRERRAAEAEPSSSLVAAPPDAA